MSARVSVAVMAHPKRERFVPSILERLDRPATIVWDQRDDRHETGRRSLLAYDPDATHHLVIQDDAIPALDLVAAVEQLLAHVPAGAPVGLYMGRLRPAHPRVAALVDYSRACGSPWITMEGPWWGPGVVVPTATIPALISFYDGEKCAGYDRRISRYFASIGVACWYTVPSLVEHRADENPSLVPGRTGHRRAHWFIGEDVSACSIDWSRPPPSITDPGFVKLPKGPFACLACPMVTSSRRSIERHVGLRHAVGAEPRDVCEAMA